MGYGVVKIIKFLIAIQQLIREGYSLIFLLEPLAQRFDFEMKGFWYRLQSSKAIRKLLNLSLKKELF